MAFPTGWNRRCALVIQHGQVTADQTALPVVITNASGCLPAEMVTSGGGNSAQSDGGDIRFTTDSAGANRIACEIAVWIQDATPSLALAEIWIPVNVLTGSDVTIYVWYNAGGGQTQPAVGAAFGRNAVWDSNYQGGVIHFPNGTTMNFYDATGINTTANPLAGGHSPIVSGAGIVDGCGTSNSTTQFADIGFLPTVFDGVNTVLTVEYWVNAANISNTSKYCPIGSAAISGNGQVRVEFGNEGTGTQIQLLVNRLTWANNFKVVTASTSLSSATWYHVVMILDVATLGNSKVYLNGSSISVVTASTGTPPTVLPTMANTTSLFLGGNSSFQGSMDELRISNIARSASWILTEYNNMNAPSSFLIAGTPTNVGGGGTALANPLSGVNPIQGFLS